MWIKREAIAELSEPNQSVALLMLLNLKFPLERPGTN
jgi:hypothetical protein